MIARNIRAYYAAGPGPEVKAVDGVSLSVDQGQVLGIAGESGCGKSTFAAVVSLTARPPLYIKGGEITLDGQTVHLDKQIAVPEWWHGEMVALLPQRAMNSLNPTAHVRDTVADVVRAHDPTVSRDAAIEQARVRLEQLSLPASVLDTYPHQLSGGMRQRVVAVISTLLNPKVLIADEPTSALDVSSQKELVLLLQLLLEHEFITRIIFITHDLPLLSNIADRIAIMYAGKLAEVGTTSQIVDQPEHPYTQALIGSVLDPEPHVRGHQLEGIAGSPPDLRYPPSGCRFHPRCPYAMDICSEKDPPQLGSEDRFAACWWVSQQSAAQSVEGIQR